ncbi:MAG: hypothetical protein ACREF4_12345 [Gammaproteobacteria bacterium]
MTPAASTIYPPRLNYVVNTANAYPWISISHAHQWTFFNSFNERQATFFDDNIELQARVTILRVSAAVDEHGAPGRNSE